MHRDVQGYDPEEKDRERERESSTGHPRRGQVDPCLVTSRGDFNETIATHGGPLGAEVRLLRVVAAVGRDLAGRCRCEHVDHGVSRAGVYAICLVLG